jgi:hypothetical protein
MNAKPQPVQTMREQQIRAALDQHWAASYANNFETPDCGYTGTASL